MDSALPIDSRAPHFTFSNPKPFGGSAGFPAPRLPETPPPEEGNEYEYKQHLKHWSIQPTRSLDGPTVAIIGVGYVGLHLVQSFGKHYKVIAFDVSKERLKDVAGDLEDLPSVIPTSNACDISSASYFLICVPTLLLPDKRIDTFYLRNAVNLLWEHAQPGSTVVIESSVSVGMTRQLLEPLMLQKGIKGGMSPERVDPGRISPPACEIPKVISGLDDLTPGSLASIRELYSHVFNYIVPVSKPEVAEMMKLYENCQRMVCIAYANEMADACIPYGIDPFEVSRAAATKPFGYAPFSPSLGVGGHCIPVNPYYLLTNCNFPLLKQATESMSDRPTRVGDREMSMLWMEREAVLRQRRASVLVVGVGFKRGQKVLSNSPGLCLINRLQTAWDAHVEFADPLVDQATLLHIPRFDTQSGWNPEGLEDFDLILVAVRQVGLDYELLGDLKGVKVTFCCE